MKKLQFWLIVLIFQGIPVFSQVAIDQSDMPKPGDTLRVSVTNNVPDGYAKTAMDTTWNYATLEALGQRIDTFVVATATPSAYQLFFVILGGANLASPRNANIIPGLPVNQGFTFFKNSAASYNDLGSAFTVQGLPLPAKYDIPDKLYEFPMPPGKTWSSTSTFSMTVPGLVFYSTQRVRSNIVDGWGSLVTPFGTFQTVRVKSILNIHDSIYIDSLATGFPFNRDIIEYKWMGKGQGIPLLQISDEGGIVAANYRDIPRMSAQPLSVTLGPDTAVFKGTSLTLHAIVKNGTPPYQIFWNTIETGDSITVIVQDIKTYSVIVIDALQNIGTAQKIVSVKYQPGIDEKPDQTLKTYPNPASSSAFIILPETCSSAVLQLLSPQGRLWKETTVYPSSGKFKTDFSDLPDGIYFIHVTTKNREYYGKIEIIK